LTQFRVGLPCWKRPLRVALVAGLSSHVVPLFIESNKQRRRMKISK
jgi:hypothetical protein